MNNQVDSSPPPPVLMTYKTIGSVELQLHVFTPPGHKAPDLRAAIVFFFGGGWNSGTPAQFYPQCGYLAGRGMVAISAEYRIRSLHHTSPAECVKDAKSAVRWIRQHAAELGIDPQKVAAGGGSAGGHIAAAAGNAKGFEEPGEDLSCGSRPDALVLFNPVLDNGPGTFGHDRLQDYWEQISPLHNIDRNAPPAIIFLGTEDDVIPVEQAEKYKELMEQSGVRCDLHLYEGQKHGFFNKERYAETLAETDRFLHTLGYIPTPPPD